MNVNWKFQSMHTYLKLMFDSERLRLDIYRRLADVKDPLEIKPIEEELIDRFGPMPDVVNALISSCNTSRIGQKVRHQGR